LQGNLTDTERGSEHCFTTEGVCCWVYHVPDDNRRAHISAGCMIGKFAGCLVPDVAAQFRLVEECSLARTYSPEGLATIDTDKRLKAEATSASLSNSTSMSRTRRFFPLDGAAIGGRALSEDRARRGVAARVLVAAPWKGVRVRFSPRGVVVTARGNNDFYRR
jgi:hypothetical protein